MTWPRVSMRHTSSWPTKQPFVNDTASRSRNASCGIVRSSMSKPCRGTPASMRAGFVRVGVDLGDAARRPARRAPRRSPRRGRRPRRRRARPVDRDAPIDAGGLGTSRRRAPRTASAPQRRRRDPRSRPSPGSEAVQPVGEHRAEAAFAARTTTRRRRRARRGGRRPACPAAASSSAWRRVADRDRVEVLRQQALQERRRVGTATRRRRSRSMRATNGVAHRISSRVERAAAAAAAAVSNACALLRHSRSSSAGTESATIPAPGLERGLPVAPDHRADRDRGVEVAGEVDVADHARVRAALGRLELVDDLHRPHLRRAAHRAGRERRAQHVDRALAGRRDRPATWLVRCMTCE